MILKYATRGHIWRRARQFGELEAMPPVRVARFQVLQRATELPKEWGGLEYICEGQRLSRIETNIPDS